MKRKSRVNSPSSLRRSEDFRQKDSGLSIIFFIIIVAVVIYAGTKLLF